MNALDRLLRKISLLRRLYKERVVVGGLLESENFRFIKVFQPGHFYSPIPDFSEIHSKSGAVFDRSARHLPAINLNEDCQLKLAKNFSALYGEIRFPDRQTKKYRYHFDNSYFSFGDAIILYSFLRYFRPKRVIEVGSGYSSAEMLDVNDHFLNKNVEFTFIEPNPDRLFGLFSEEDRKKHRIEKRPVQELASDVFTSLGENDILFIDLSHVAKINSDVLHLVFNILPRLNKGVIVHFHDVLWPFEYPKRWLAHGRAWNEAYFLRAFLQYNTNFEILYFNSYMAAHHAKTLEAIMPRVFQAPSSELTPGNTSLWIRKTL